MGHRGRQIEIRHSPTLSEARPNSLVADYQTTLRSDKTLTPRSKTKPMQFFDATGRNRGTYA